MPCYKPLVFEKFGLKSNGKINMKICNRFTGNYEDYQNIDKYELVPCGQCIGCRLDYAKQWAERCSLEAAMYEENMFLTLTYNDENLPLNCSKKDFQLFIKRLRNHFSDREIRFFGCGERGSLSGRPHYHIIIFNAKFNDLKYLKHSGENNLYTSPTLEKLWPYGFSTIGEADYNSINYTARYVMKKIKGKQSDEFLLMSRRPGIGAEYLKKNIDKIKAQDLIYFPFSESKKQASLSRYFKNQIEIENPDYFKNKKKELIESIQAKNCSDKQVYTVDSLMKLNQVKESLKKAQIKALKRGL